MRLDHIEPFIDATNRVLEAFKVQVRTGRLSLCEKPVASRGLVIAVGITGGVEGMVIFDMKQETAIEMARIMNGLSFDSLQPLVIDSIAELVNMITGKTVTILNDKGFNLKPTPPMAFTGSAAMHANIHIETLLIPFTTDLGEFVINVALRPGIN